MIVSSLLALGLVPAVIFLFLMHCMNYIFSHFVTKEVPTTCPVIGVFLVSDLERNPAAISLETSLSLFPNLFLFVICCFIHLIFHDDKGY